MAQAMDTRLFSWSEAEIRVGGLLMVGAQALSWTERQEKEYIYGKGDKPIAIKSGNESIEGSITLLQNELERLKDIAPGGKLYRLKDMTIQVAFANAEGRIVRYSITGVEFTDAAHNIAQNDKRMQVELPFMALDSKRQ